MTKLDLQQIVRMVYDPATNSLKMSDSSEVSIAIDAAEDSVSVRPLSTDVQTMDEGVAVDVLNVRGYSLHVIPDGTAFVAIEVSNDGTDWIVVDSASGTVSEMLNYPDAMHKFVRYVSADSVVVKMVTKG